MDPRIPRTTPSGRGHDQAQQPSQLCR